MIDYRLGRESYLSALPLNKAGTTKETRTENIPRLIYNWNGTKVLNLLEFVELRRE